MTQTPSDDREGDVDGSPEPVAGPPRTGDPAVDAALAAAAAVQSADPGDQLDAYVGTHRALQDRLADSGA